MALEDVLRHIDRQADAEIARIAEAARAEAERLLAQARDEAAGLHRELLSAESATVAAQRRRLRRQAAAEAARIRWTAREEAFQAALTEAAGRLGGTRDLPGYPALLQSLLVEALAAVAEPATVRADPRDAATVARLLTGRNLTVEPCLHTWAGAEVASADGRVVARNTLEVRLAQAEPYLRSLVARTAPVGDREVPAC